MWSSSLGPAWRTFGSLREGTTKEEEIWAGGWLSMSGQAVHRQCWFGAELVGSPSLPSTWDLQGEMASNSKSCTPLRPRESCGWLPLLAFHWGLMSGDRWDSRPAGDPEGPTAVDSLAGLQSEWILLLLDATTGKLPGGLLEKPWGSWGLASGIQLCCSLGS